VPDASMYGLFITAALTLLLVPGPAVLYVVTRSMDQGRLVGFVSVLGIGLGTLVHVAFAAVGLSALLASSAAAFSVVKWLGAAYLVWLGLRRLFARDNDEQPAVAEPKHLSRVFLQGVIVNFLNPKTALFFLAFLPQFVVPSQGSAWTQVMVLGTTLVLLGLLTDGLYALLSGTAGTWLRQRNADFRQGQRYVSGSVYLALGVASAASGSGKD
jgi:threonine/homoserine/homoserine lactone efflux protein